MTTVTIPLPWLRPPATSNQRGNWRADAPRRKAARDGARWAIRARASSLPKLTPPIAFTIHWQIPDAITRDADGLALTGKACLDACVDERLIPGDSWRIVRLTAQTIHPPEAGKSAAMWMTLEEVRP